MNVMLRNLGCVMLSLLAIGTAQAQVCYRGDPVTVIVDGIARSGARLICDGRDIGVDLDPVYPPTVYVSPPQIIQYPPVRYYAPPAVVYLGRQGVGVQFITPYIGVHTHFDFPRGHHHGHGHRHH